MFIFLHRPPILRRSSRGLILGVRVPQRANPQPARKLDRPLLHAERAARGEAEADVDAREHREGAVVEGAGHVARVEHDECGGSLGAQRDARRGGGSRRGSQHAQSRRHEHRVLERSEPVVRYLLWPRVWLWARGVWRRACGCGCGSGSAGAGAGAGAGEAEVEAEAEVERGNARPVEVLPRRHRRRRARRSAAGSRTCAPRRARARRARRSTQQQRTAAARRRARSTALAAPPSWRPTRAAPR